MELSKVAEELKFLRSGEYRADCDCEHCKAMPEVVSSALNLIETVQKAEMPVVECNGRADEDIPDDKESAYNLGYESGQIDYRQNCLPLIVKKDLRIKELEAENKELKKGVHKFPYEVHVPASYYHELVLAYQDLESIKRKVCDKCKESINEKV